MLKIINAKSIARFDNWMNAINPPIELGDDISIVPLLFVESLINPLPENRII